MMQIPRRYLTLNAHNQQQQPAALNLPPLLPCPVTHTNLARMLHSSKVNGGYR